MKCVLPISCDGTKGGGGGGGGGFTQNFPRNI